ncbi:response regulator [Salinisphaera sp. Q1T1-3]|uniref:response regulator n=1 Tax=Salinisphaera sp. Q1T1-3 TaxID=2321229 RepID=UPI000E770A4A|nr:response regulator [Salinisphaera sp. Q1T1-3]RJS95080.1 response regulator [Salinisphaera sp. Q1T1-3]
MKDADIAPYFHPTQIVLVDDDIDFLGNLSLQLDSDLAYLLFDSTSKALDYLTAHNGRSASRERFFQRTSAGSDAGTTPRPLEIDCHAIQQEMGSSERFSQVSVVLVDYAMPEIDGIEFCRRINDPHIKKILFTGVATESVAVDAFNKGVIDQYIRKQERAVYDTLNQAIRSFQREYIRDLFVAAADIFSMRTPPILSDPATPSLLDALARDHGMIEYYLADEPPGMLFADAAGRVQRLVALDARECAAEAQRLAALGLPDSAVAEIESGARLCDPALTRDDMANWREHSVVPTVSGHALGARYWAVFPVSDPLMSQARPSYEAFLEWLDTVGYALM